MTIQINAKWLEIESRDKLQVILAEYRFLVHRFVQWMGLTLGKSSDERVRQLLLHNLIDECGRIGGEPSHLSRLDSCLASCGVSASKGYTPSSGTGRVEQWFFDVFSQQNSHTCLSVLGPGTESISQQFLKPLEAGLRRAFAGEPVDYTYFDLHRPEVEVIHAEDIARALALIEESAEVNERCRLEQEREYWSSEAVAHHAAFWDGLNKVQ